MSLNQWKDDFWNLIKTSRSTSKNIPSIQEIIIIDKLASLEIDKIYFFCEYYSYLSAKLESNYTLLNLLEGETDFIITDDSWYYFCLGIVALGKKVYMTALENPNNFLKLLKSNIYGKIQNIAWEFHSLKFSVLKKKYGFEIDNIEEFIDSKFKKTIENYFKNGFK